MFATRFAPSPTGYLHLGHAFSAWTAFEAAQYEQGRFILRIEDTDLTRCRPEFEAAVYEDLAWLGITWESPVRRQSDHMADYEAALERLSELGVLYRCFKTRRELMEAIASAPHSFQGPEPVAPLDLDEEAEQLASGKPYAWRLSLARSAEIIGEDWDRLGFEANGIWVKADPRRLGDIVLARKEFPSSYHLASVLDDASQGITHVIRGEDLAEAAHIHIVLQKLLGLPTPIYRHHRLILDTDGKRFAKRNQSVTLRSLRESGTSPAEIRSRLGL